MFCTRGPVGVARVRGEYRAMAFGPIAAGAEIMVVEGRSADRATRFTVQVDEDTHIDLPPGITVEDQIDRYTWRFVNHACAPNAALRGRSLVACRPIATGEEITFNYDSTEFEVAAPFQCHCGSPGCDDHLVRGFKHLTPTERERLRPLLADHLARLLVDQDAIAG